MTSKQALEQAMIAAFEELSFIARHGSSLEIRLQAIKMILELSPLKKDAPDPGVSRWSTT